MKIKNGYLYSLTLTFIVLLLTSCAGKKSMYYWGNYQDTLYAYYQIDKASVLEQISSLHKIIDKANSSGKKVPPGLHAQLGLLYTNTGQTQYALAQFKTEKDLFPESTEFINFIEKKFNEKQKAK